MHLQRAHAQRECRGVERVWEAMLMAASCKERLGTREVHRCSIAERRLSVIESWRVATCGESAQPSDVRASMEYRPGSKPGSGRDGSNVIVAHLHGPRVHGGTMGMCTHACGCVRLFGCGHVDEHVRVCCVHGRWVGSMSTPVYLPTEPWKHQARPPAQASPGQASPGLTQSIPMKPNPVESS